MFAAAHPLLATNDTYIGPPGGDWNTSTYWSPVGIPQPGDNVTFAPAGSASYTYDGNYDVSSPLASLTIGDSISSTPTLNQSGGTLAASYLNVIGGVDNQSGGTLNASTITIGNGTGSSATDTVSGGTLNAITGFVGFGGGAGTLIQSGTSVITVDNMFSPPSDLTIGDGTGSTGVASFGGGSLNLVELDVGANNGAGTVTLSGPSFVNLLVVGLTGGNGTLNITAGTLSGFNIEIGASGPGTLLWQNGTSFINGGVIVGVTSAGTAIFSAGTLTTNEIDVGGEHTPGTLIQSGTSNISVYDLYVGPGFSSASGEADFTAGTFSAQYISVDRGSNGTFLQSGTSFINLGQGSMQVACASDRNGTMSLSGGTFLGGDVMIGAADSPPQSANGQGTLLQSGTSYFSPNILEIGLSSPGYAILSAGTLNVPGGIAVGEGATGTLLQSGTSFISTPGLGLGEEPDGPVYAGSGFMSLSGGTLATNLIYVGVYGAGTLLQSGTSFINLVSGSLIIGNGSASLSGGTLSATAGTIIVGYNAVTGSLSQSGTSYVNLGCGTLNIGDGTGSRGTTNLTGGSITAGNTIIGAGGGVGTLLQGGTSYINLSSGSLVIGNGTGSAGTVNLSGGSLSANYVDIGASGGAGTLLQSGTSNINLGTGTLIVGDGTASTGLASISGGTFTALQGYIGLTGGSGTLLQSGTSEIVFPQGDMEIGDGTGANGTIIISGGTFSGPYPGMYMDVGASIGTATVLQGGAGTLQQSGTSTTNLGMYGRLQIGNGTGSSGTVSLSGGTLNAGVGILVGVTGGTGLLTQSGSSDMTLTNYGGLEIGSGTDSTGTANFSGGSLNILDGSIYVGDDGFGTLIQSGTSFINLPNGELVIGDGGASAGTAILGGGSLSAGYVYVGSGSGAGTLLQSGTSNINVGTLIIGDIVEASGTAILSGGTLTVGQFFVAQSGNGLVSQTAGALAVTGSLQLGYNLESAGTYNLSGGSLSVTAESTDELVGSSGGAGTFIQSGGTNVANFLYIGYGTLATGAYFLSGGTLDIAAGHTYESIGYLGTGTFVQTGGTHLTTEFAIGWRGSGTYDLESGTLVVTGTSTDPFEVIGSESPGIGVFIQSGGTHIVTSGASDGLELGYAFQASGSYTLTAGTLDVNAPEFIGESGRGTFNQSGGINQINGTLTLAAFAGANGTYNLQAGTLTATATNVGPGGGGGTFLQSGSLSASSLGTLTINASVLTLSGGTMNASSINSSGTLTITGGTLAITGAGSLGASTISSSGLSISGTGMLDVGSSGLVIEYGNGTSPVGDLSFGQTARNYPGNSIQRYAQTGFNALNWNGPGIISSVAENDSSGLTAVGVADENDLANVYPANYTVAGGGSGTWMGQPINDPNNVLVRYTYYGDGNLDGVVNKFDVAALAQGYSGLAGYIGWSDGDYTYAGYISKLDISLLAQSYIFQGAPLGDAITPGQAQYLLALDPGMSANVQAEFDAIAAGQTPEPASVALCGLAVFGLLRGRNRRGLSLRQWKRAEHGNDKNDCGRQD